MTDANNRENQDGEDEADPIGSEQANDTDLDTQFSQLISQLDDLDAFDPGETSELTNLDKSAPYFSKLNGYKCLAVVLTPVASAQALSALCALSGVNLTIVPAQSGAMAFKAVECSNSDAQFSALLGSGREIPDEVNAIGDQLAKLTRTPVVAVVSWLAPGNDAQPELSGQVASRRYINGKEPEDLPSGLVVAQMDQIVEDILLGRIDPTTISGTEISTQMPRWKALRMLGKGLRRPKR